MPVGDKKLTVKFPAEKIPTLSGKNYANQEIDFTYTDGWINGLPEVCMDSETFKIVESKKSMNSGTYQMDCYAPGNHNVWKKADVLVPSGTTVTEEDPDTGETNHYVLKATFVDKC